MNEETRIEGQEFLADEYMTKAEYASIHPGVVKEALTVAMAEQSDYAAMLGPKDGTAETAESVKEIRRTANASKETAEKAKAAAATANSTANAAQEMAVTAQTTADEATGKANEAMVGLAGKVDTIDGKGLSANDYTTAEKAKLAEMRAEPAGCMKLFAGNVLPEGYLWCDGGSYPTVGTYAKLFGAIGTTYNKPGAAAGTFNVPDLRGRVGVGKDEDAFSKLGDAKGEKEHKLIANEIPPLKMYSTSGFTFGFNESGKGTLNGLNIMYNGAKVDTFATTRIGDTTFSHNNLQPYLVCNYIIKY